MSCEPGGILSSIAFEDKQINLDNGKNLAFAGFFLIPAAMQSPSNLSS